MFQALESVVFLRIFAAILHCAIFVTHIHAADVRVLEPKLRHLRNGEREWSEFPQTPEADALRVTFNAGKNGAEQTLQLRQQDVKQRWNVTLNGKLLGQLPNNENDMVVYFAVPAGTLQDGENVLEVAQKPPFRASDDVRVGDARLIDAPREAALAEAQVEIEVREGDTPTPCRLTILSADGALQTPGAKSSETLAVRPGVIYTGSGRAKFGLPAGEYTIIAGRGFEYGIDRVNFTLEPGDSVRHELAITREVPTPGLVACDTHVHSLTFSGHGDATIEERIVTLAGEGVELPIVTEHNRHTDYEPFARKQGLRKFFTPVVGNEVTTKFGHFNAFPTTAQTPIPDYKQTRWEATTDAIFATPGMKVAILNHARDLHSGFRPFGPEHFNPVSGENLDGWQLRANGMEVINSGATQSDAMELTRDWMALLNRGRLLTPVGSSDSHDVARHFVGQGRTYIRADDRDPGDIDVGEAVNAFLQGRVQVSYGLLADIRVDGKYEPGELAASPGETRVDVEVLGPSWTTADVVELYANGRKVREAKIEEGEVPGVKWSGTWTLPKVAYDRCLVAVARGPGIASLYWPTAKAYQPTSPDWTPHVLAVTGAVWIDGDGNTRRTPAIDYARTLVPTKENDLEALLQRLGAYDEAVAAQAASLLHPNVVNLHDEQPQRLLRKSSPAVRRGVKAFLEAWRETQAARAEK